MSFRCSEMTELAHLRSSIAIVSDDSANAVGAAVDIMNKDCLFNPDFHFISELTCREHPGRGIIEDQPIEPVADEIARVVGLAAP